MRVNRRVSCRQFPCKDVLHGTYYVPGVSIDADRVSIILISEAAPADPRDDYYARGKPLFEETTVLAFREAGANVSSVRELLARGIYLTTAVKCAKTRYGLATDTVKACSVLLEQELGLFPNAHVLLLMGDVAIKAVNAIAQRAGEERVIPAGSTYKIRGGEFSFRGMRVLPSYLQAGPSYFIEKSKRKAIAEDIATALRLVQ